MNDVKPNGKVHPIAALFPMMSNEELDALAATIKTDGLHNPIVLDEEGTLIDGRNRQEACRRVGIKPAYEVLNGQDVMAFVLESNATRRHMTKGQLALVAVKAHLTQNQLPETGKLPHGIATRLSQLAGVRHQLISDALAIFQYAPKSVDLVITGSKSFEEALLTAKDSQAEANSAEEQMKQLREDADDLAELVAEERMKLSEALAALRTRREEDRRLRQHSTELLRDVVQILDPRATTPKRHAKTFIENFDVKFSTEDITRRRLRACLTVLTEIVNLWEDSHAVPERDKESYIPTIR
jgi:ParB-like chromosome segregation protein Spo0J